MTTQTIKTFFDEAKAQDQLRTYHADINLDLTQHSGMYSHYASLLTKAETQYERISYTIEKMEARRDAAIRAEMDATGEKATEGKIKAKLTLDPMISDLRRLLIDAKEQVSLLKVHCDALKHRKDCLMQLAMNMREEFKGSPTIMGNANKENRHERLKALSLNNEFVKIA